MPVMYIWHVMVRMGEGSVTVWVGMFPGKIPFMVMGGMVIIMGVGMIVQHSRMGVGMFMFIVDEHNCANHHDRQGNDEQPTRQFLKDNE